MDELTREFLIESQEALDRMERCLTALEERPHDAERLGEIFRSVHTIKGATGFLGFHRLERLAHAGENLLSQLRDGKLIVNQPIITGLLQLLDALRTILHTIETDNHEGQSADSLQSDHRMPDDLLIARLGELQNPVGAPYSINPSSPVHQDLQKLPIANSTLHVDVTLLNHMKSLITELAPIRDELLQAALGNPHLSPLAHRLDRVTTDLQESILQSTMQPISHVFSKFPRLIRDLSKLLNRKVRLVTQGQEIELDRTLLEAIKDPLTHAVRNALDHGIEPPDARLTAGKSAEGTLQLRAYTESEHVIVEVADDGAGIRVDRVRSKAIERGLIVAECAAQLSKDELMQLIFLPGFSTAEAVTYISGRGVGMDVVRINVEKIGGRVEIDSHPGKGTTLKLLIPRRVATAPAFGRSVTSQFHQATSL